MNRTRIGVIGAGRMGITHLSIIKSDPRIEVSSIADNSGMVLDTLGRYLGCRSFKDYRELLREDRPQALLVCTPPNLHFEIVQKAGEAGMHVFAEKPFTTSSKLAHQLADQFEQARLFNQVGYVNRFNDVFVRVRSLLQQGVIGPVVRYRSEMFSRTVVRKAEGGGGWRGSHATGGGATFEMASHAIDLVNFFIGKPHRVVGAALDHLFSEQVEDIVSATFLHGGGCTGTLLVNWSDDSVRKPTNKIELFGEKGKILCDQHSIRVYLKRPDPQHGLHDGWNNIYITEVFRPVPFYVRGNEYTRQLYHFVDGIHAPPEAAHCSFRAAAQTLEVIEAILADGPKNRES